MHTNFSIKSEIFAFRESNVYLLRIDESWFPDCNARSVTGCSRTVMRIIMLDLVPSDLTASAEGWSLTTTGILEIAIIPFAGNTH